MFQRDVLGRSRSCVAGNLGWLLIEGLFESCNRNRMLFFVVCCISRSAIFYLTRLNRWMINATSLNGIKR